MQRRSPPTADAAAPRKVTMTDRAPVAGAASPLARSLLTLREKAAPAGAARLGQHIERLRRRLTTTQFDVVIGLVAALEAKDPYTERHSVRVTAYAEYLARRAGMVEHEIELIRRAALLHDVGKIGIPDAILQKAGPLTAEEYAMMKRHPSIGASIVEQISFLRREVPLILHHHEWYNGCGYPAGLVGEAIPRLARIIQTADCIDAMLSPRVYRDDMSVEHVIVELLRGRGGQFDPALVDLAVPWLEGHVGEPVIPGVGLTVELMAS